MPTLNGNNAYLEFDGQDLSGWWTGELSKEGSAETEDVTAGAGVTAVQREPALTDGKMNFMVVYDTSDIPIYRAKLKEGHKGILKYGPESNVAGKPKHEQMMILAQVKQNQSIEKKKVSFELSFEQADAAIATIAGGGVFP